MAYILDSPNIFTTVYGMWICNAPERKIQSLATPHLYKKIKRQNPEIAKLSILSGIDKAKGLKNERKN